MTPLLDIEHLGFSYAPEAPPLFEDLSLSVSRGDFVLVRGASGCGKSTLLRLICRLVPRGSGHILFKGVAVEDILPAELRRAVIYVAQIPVMSVGSVKHNLLFPFSFAANKGKETPSDEELSSMLERFYLQDIDLLREAGTLSVGQQQRLALMRAILLEPEILLLDEPTSSLDSESAALVFRIVERLNSEHDRTIVTVTHSDYAPSGVAKPRSFRLENAKLRPA